MVLCTDCLHADERKIAHCPSCGGSSFAKVTKTGDLTSVPAEAGMPCQSCFERDRHLQLRYYRRVLAMIVVDRIWGEAGYFCSSCRWKHFGKNLAFTLVLGWWGLAAAFVRNPYAIAVNVWALFAPPFSAGELGAINVADIRRAGEAEDDGDDRLSDVYMRMPGWMESLSEHDVDRILSGVDYYEALRVPPDASHAEIKSSWRELAKTHHPDRAGADGHAKMVSINAAWEVLGDERLRHAYDHRDELLGFLQQVDAAHATDYHEPDEEGTAEMVIGCVECRLGFASFDDAADHVDEVHPHTDYLDILVSLVDDDLGGEAGDAVAARWRCKTCAATFSEYSDALDHADRAHPDQLSVDPRMAVEAV
jgi:hypothetical protein